MIDGVVRLLGRPGVQFWLSSTSLARAAIPQPEGVAVVHTAGTNPARVLVIGSGAAIGFGVFSHELALAGHIGRQLSALTGRAMDVDILVEREMTISSIRGWLARQPIARYDAIVITVGLIEALTFTRVSAWRRDLDATIDYLQSLAHAEQQVFVVAVPPLGALQKYPAPIRIFAGRHARLINAATRELSERRARVTYLPFEASPSQEADRFRGSATYARWAELLVPPIAAKLSSFVDHTELTSIDPDDESDRQASLEALNILDTAAEERFDRIAITARDLLGTASAAIVFVDKHRHWFKSRIGMDIEQMPRFSSLCDVTIQRREHFAIEDATLDPRFAANPLVVGAPHMRFYAGYPIEAPNGIRVGTLSVFDPHPRSFTDADAALLRGLALMVQNELRTV
jgi:GAF domain-containing protein